MKSIFDAFRSDGGPTLYTFNNRTPVTGDVNIITISVVFLTLLTSFLIIFAGIRKEKFTTFITVTLSLFVGSTILVTLYGSSWHVANADIISNYHAFSKNKIFANIGAYVGLDHVNVTLRASELNNNSWSSDIDFNERFFWHASDQMGHCYTDAIIRGLPFPILTVAEYFSLNQEGFSWGGQYRAAGYYASNVLWASFSLWLLMNLLLIVVPRYGAYMMVLCGSTLIFASYIYCKMIPVHPLTIRFEGGVLDFNFGWCFWTVLVAGIACTVEGVCISIVDLVYPNSFSTILEVDYDTPYDRHIIIEDSKGRRFKKKPSNNKFDEADLSFGSRILRRLSSKTKEPKEEALVNNKSPAEDLSGIINEGFEPTPKSPWRYPYEETEQFSFKRSPVSRHDATVLNIVNRRESFSSESGSASGSVELPPIQRKSEQWGISHYPNMHKNLTRTFTE